MGPAAPGVQTAGRTTSNAIVLEGQGNIFGGVQRLASERPRYCVRGHPWPIQRPDGIVQYRGNAPPNQFPFHG